MINENGVRRVGVLAIALSTVGVLAILFVVISAVFVGFAINSVSGSVKSLAAAASSHKSTSSKTNYAVPVGMRNYIAGIKLSGEISNLTADEIIDKLETAKADKNAVGILLEVSSPGGAVVPSQEIYDEVKQVKSVKPVVVYVREMAASGAYYSSASASKIVANRGSLIGSIGVIMNGFEADKLIQFLKINPITIKTGALKDTGSPTRPMNESDKKYLQSLIEATRNLFVSDVKNGRNVDEKTLSFMSDGRVILASQAFELKLVDAIGTKQQALADISNLAKQKTVPELFYYENIESFSDIFAQKFSGKASYFIQNSLMKIFENPANSVTRLKAE